MYKHKNKNYIIQNLNAIKPLIKKEELNIAVICYGGCCSNQLSDVLAKNNYKSRSQTWTKILCHCPHYVDLGIPILYLYDNPIKSYLSMKRRGKELCVINHRKLSNNPLANYSDEYLLQCMIKQFKSFTLRPLPNVLVIKSDELFQPAIHEKLKQFLHKSVLKEFPIKFVPPKTDINEFSAADAVTARAKTTMM